MTDRDKRTLMIGGIIVGVLIVVFLALKLLGGGGGTEQASFSPHSTTSAPGGTTGGGSGSESPSLAPSPVLELPVRDPFAIPAGFPLPSGTTSGGTTTSGGSTTSGGTTTTPTIPTTSVPTTTSAPGKTPGAPSGATQTVGGHQVTLIDAFTTNGVERATVSVDGTVYTVSAGQTFGPNKEYKLQSVSGNCATFLFGDQSFTLCVPQNK
jgi:hypothetical protein